MKNKLRNRKVSLGNKAQSAWNQGMKTAATKPITQKSKAGAELTGAIK